MSEQESVGGQDAATQKIDTTGGGWQDDPDQAIGARAIVVGILTLMILVAGVWYVFLRDDGDSTDFTAVDAAAQTRQQACYDSGLFYDELGNCYSIDPAMIRPEDRPSFLVLAGAPADEVLEQDAQGDTAPAPDGGNTGQANPSIGGGGSSLGGGGRSGPANPSGSGGGSSSGGGSGSGGQANPSGGTNTTGSTGSTGSTGGTTTPQPTQQPTTQPSTQPTQQPTTQPTTQPTADPNAPAPIVATSSDEWVFRMSKTVPNGQDCEVPDGGGLNDLSPECQVYQAAYSGSASFQCDHSSDGTLGCPKQNDGNRDNTITGKVQRNAIGLTRTGPGGTFTMGGNNVQDGSTPGEVCDISGPYTQNFSMNGNAVSQSGTYTGSRNAPGC